MKLTYDGCLVHQRDQGATECALVTYKHPSRVCLPACPRISPSDRLSSLAFMRAPPKPSAFGMVKFDVDHVCYHPEHMKLLSAHQRASALAANLGVEGLGVEACSHASTTFAVVEAGYSQTNENALLAAVHLAFAQHRPLYLSPDIVWNTIVQGMSHHVSDNPERYRHASRACGLSRVEAMGPPPAFRCGAIQGAASAASAALLNVGDALTGGHLAFATAIGGGATVSVMRMRITNTGSVGISASTPAYALDVSGGMRVTGQLTNSCTACWFYTFTTQSAANSNSNHQVPLPTSCWTLVNSVGGVPDTMASQGNAPSTE